MTEYQEIATILFDNKDNLPDNDYLRLFNLLGKLKDKNNEENAIIIQDIAICNYFIELKKKLVRDIEKLNQKIKEKKEELEQFDELNNKKNYNINIYNKYYNC